MAASSANLRVCAVRESSGTYVKYRPEIPILHARFLVHITLSRSHVIPCFLILSNMKSYAKMHFQGLVASPLLVAHRSAAVAWVRPIYLLLLLSSVMMTLIIESDDEEVAHHHHPTSHHQQPGLTD